jgi:hypothetical protein
VDCFVAIAPRNDGSGNTCDKFDTTGKSLLIIRNRVKPVAQKYSAGHVGQITGISSRIPAHTRGVSRSSRCVGLGRRWTLWRQAFFAPDENAEAYGEVVWSWRRDAGAKLAGSIPPMTVTTSPLHRGEHEVSRKAIAQGMSECFRSPVCSCAPNAQFLAHETAGAACTRHSLRPLFKRGTTNLQKLGRNAPRDR